MEKRIIEVPRKGRPIDGSSPEGTEVRVIPRRPTEERDTEEEYSREEMRETRKNRIKKKKRQRVLVMLSRLLLAVTTLVVSVALIVGIIYLACDVKEVNVTGTDKYSAEEIRDYVLNDEYSFNSVYVYLKNRIFPVKSIPFIETVTVSLSSPNTVVIELTEKDLFAYVMAEDGRYVYFDGDGVVQEISDRLIENVLLISGISCEEASVGENLPVDDKTLLGVLTLIKNLRKNEIEAEAPSFDKKGDLWVLCGTVSVNFGSVDNIAEKVTRLHIILPQVQGMTGVLHLEDWTPDHTDIIFEKTG